MGSGSRGSDRVPAGYSRPDEGLLESSSRRPKWLWGWVVVYFLLTVLAVLLIGLWVGNSGGAEWGNVLRPNLMFNLHPLFMVLGFIVVVGHSEFAQTIQTFTLFIQNKTNNFRRISIFIENFPIFYWKFFNFLLKIFQFLIWKSWLIFTRRQIIISLLFFTIWHEIHLFINILLFVCKIMPCDDSSASNVFYLWNFFIFGIFYFWNFFMIGIFYHLEFFYDWNFFMIGIFLSLEFFCLQRICSTDSGRTPTALRSGSPMVRCSFSGGFCWWWVCTRPEPVRTTRRRPILATQPSTLSRCTAGWVWRCWSSWHYRYTSRSYT